MPARVPNVAWKCPQCGKRRWLKPSIAKNRRSCSRACYYESQKVANPVREKRANVVVRYGVRECPQCGTQFEAKTKNQTFCSQNCAARNLKGRRRVEGMPPRPCEHCGVTFTPRQGSAGRFCSRPCTYAGQKGERAINWRGGRHVTTEGYVRTHRPDHPNADNFGYISEHRVVMEEKIGRLLDPTESVHHINGDRADNRPENLQLRQGKHGRGAKFVCLDCGSHNIKAVKLD